MKPHRLLILPLVLIVTAFWVTIDAKTAKGQAAQLESAEGEAAEPKKEELEKVPPKVPAELPGYFPKGSPPIAANTLELSSITTALGPASGVLAPYGNTAAYDTLLRGWQTHKVGAVRVSPFLEYDGIYRSNAFLTSTDKQSAFINSINPGVRLELPLAQRHKISVGYLGNYFIWTRFSDFSHYDHNANVDLVLNFRGGLSVQMGNALRYATEEPSGTQARKRPYYRDSPYFQATYSLANKWRVQGFYQFDLFDFRDAADRGNDYQQHAGGATLYYKFWPKTAALVQYIITSRTYPNNPQDNNVIHTPFIGLTWDPTAKISGTAKFGYSFTTYDQKLAGRDNSPGSFAMSVQGLYRYSRYTNLSLTLQRSKQDDVDNVNNNPFWNTGVFLTLSHEWHYFKVSSYVGFAYTNNSYINSSLDGGTGEIKKREDNIYFLNAGVSRPLTRWLRLRLDYSFINRSSNFSGNTYNDHRILIGLQASI